VPAVPGGAVPGGAEIRGAARYPSKVVIMSKETKIKGAIIFDTISIR
jgi:hypothetical protein